LGIEVGQALVKDGVALKYKKGRCMSNINVIPVWHFVTIDFIFLVGTIDEETNLEICWLGSMEMSAFIGTILLAAGSMEEL